MLAKIEFIKPEGADAEDVAQFIIDCLSSWGGSLHPEDPMFRSLELKKVTVNGRQFEVEK